MKCRLGLPCPEPCVEEAIEGLRRDMLGLGLIWDEPQPDRDRKRQIRTRWSLTDDVIPAAMITTKTLTLVKPPKPGIPKPDKEKASRRQGKEQ